MSLSDTDRLIIESVESHYENNDSPYLLAELGVFFHVNEIDVPEGVRLKEYLTIRFADRLVIVQDEDVPAKIAIAPPELEAIVRQMLSGKVSDLADESIIDFTRLPIALVSAFCKNPPPNRRLYFRITKPFRYEMLTEPPDSNYVEIEERFRPNPLSGKGVRDISLKDKQIIFRHIETWAKEKRLDLRDVYYDREARNGEALGTAAGTGENALQRLIDAQEPELRARILIPADIVRSLLEIR